MILLNPAVLDKPYIRGTVYLPGKSPNLKTICTYTLSVSIINSKENLYPFHEFTFILFTEYL